MSWGDRWYGGHITPFFGYPPQIRKVVYTTNVIESVNMSLRKITKNRNSFPSDEALMELCLGHVYSVCYRCLTSVTPDQAPHV